MTLKEIRSLIKARKYEGAFARLERGLVRHRECPYLWILRGDLIQLLDSLDGPPLKEAAKSYSQALKLNPNNLEAIESLAHFYDAVDPKPAKAKRYAATYIKKAERGLFEMNQIRAEEP